MPDGGLLCALAVLLFGAGLVNGMIGFGLALLAVNALAVVLGAKAGVVTMSLIAPCISGLQLWHLRAHLHGWSRFRTVILGALAGTVIGARLLVILPGGAISVALGLFTAWFVVTQLRAERPALRARVERAVAPLAGLAAGISSGSLGASGPVLGTYLTAIGLRGSVFAAVISLIFFSMAAIRGALFAAGGLYAGDLVATALVLIGPTLAGQRVGFWLEGRLDANRLQQVILLVLLVASLDLLVQGAGAFLATA